MKNKDKISWIEKRRISRKKEKQIIDEIKKQITEEKNEDIVLHKKREELLETLSEEEKKEFIKTEKEKKKQDKINKKSEKAKKRQEYRALSKEDKVDYRRKRRLDRKLHKKAKKGYIAWQVLKYGLIAAAAVGIVFISIFVYGVFFDNSYAFQNTSEMNVVLPQVSAQAESVADVSNNDDEVQATPTPTINPYDLLIEQADIEYMMQDRVNILVLGIDESQEREDWNSYRTDTMILLSIDFAKEEVYMISLPRDSFVWIYSKNYLSRINTAFGSGGGKDGEGFEYAMNTVSLLLGGIPVNNYICFDMDVVKEIVDAIGGLYYDVDIEFDMGENSYELGYQYLDGQGVLDYCRERHVDSDIGRTSRQRSMIMALYEEMKKTSQLQDIPALYTAVSTNIYTDLNLSQICSLAAFAMDIQSDRVLEYSLPGGYLTIDGTDLWGVNQYKKRDMVKEIFGLDIKVSKTDHLTYLRDLAEQKNNAVSDAKAAIEKAQAYVSKNSAYILAEELSRFNQKKSELSAVAAIKNVHNVGSTIQPIRDEIVKFNKWFNDSFVPSIEARKALPSPTPAATETPAASE